MPANSPGGSSKILGQPIVLEQQKKATLVVKFTGKEDLVSYSWDAEFCFPGRVFFFVDGMGGPLACDGRFLGWTQTCLPRFLETTCDRLQVCPYSFHWKSIETKGLPSMSVSTVVFQFGRTFFLSKSRSCRWDRKKRKTQLFLASFDWIVARCEKKNSLRKFLRGRILRPSLHSLELKMHILLIHNSNSHYCFHSFWFVSFCLHIYTFLSFYLYNVLFFSVFIIVSYLFI